MPTSSSTRVDGDEGFILPRLIRMRKAVVKLRHRFKRADDLNAAHKAADAGLNGQPVAELGVFALGFVPIAAPALEAVLVETGEVERTHRERIAYQEIFVQNA